MLKYKPKLNKICLKKNNYSKKLNNSPNSNSNNNY